MQTELSRSTEAQEICVQPRDYRSKDCMSEMHNALGMIMLLTYVVDLVQIIQARRNHRLID